LGLEQLRSVFQDQLSDRADEFTTQTNQNFMEQTPIFDSLTRSSVINFTTVTNTSPAFPQTYSPLNEIIKFL